MEWDTNAVFWRWAGKIYRDQFQSAGVGRVVLRFGGFGGDEGLQGLIDRVAHGALHEAVGQVAVLLGGESSPLAGVLPIALAGTESGVEDGVLGSGFLAVGDGPQAVGGQVQL